MWIEMTPETLLSRLAGAEHDALRTAATAFGQGDPLEEIAAQVAADWRGGLRRVGPVDRRPGFVPDEVLIHILAHFRYSAFTRLPGMSALLDEPRVREWERANQVRENLAKLTIAPPDDDYLDSAKKATPGVIVPPSILG